MIMNNILETRGDCGCRRQAYPGTAIHGEDGTHNYAGW